MRAVVQRVKGAKVEVDGRTVGKIGQGILIFLGIGEGDSEKESDQLAGKIAHLRIFSDEKDLMNLSLTEIRGEALVVSQFTLYADCRRGRRPSFSKAARPEVAEPLVEHFVQSLRLAGVPTESGTFGAMMLVEIHNDGPVTIVLGTEDLRRPRRS